MMDKSTVNAVIEGLRESINDLIKGHGYEAVDKIFGAIIIMQRFIMKEENNGTGQS